MERILKMIKGVNKQIIEIRCPKDERFEKILLFVNANQGGISRGETDEKAKCIAKSFLAGKNTHHGAAAMKSVVKKHSGAIGLSAAGVALTALCLILIFF